MRTLIHAVEVAFESIYVSGPEPAELSQPGIYLFKWFGFQVVETALRIHRGFHEAGIAQHAQVLGHGRLRHTKLTLDLSDRLLRRDQEAQYGAAVGLRNDFEDRFHCLDILYGAYTCQGILWTTRSLRTATSSANAINFSPAALSLRPLRLKGFFYGSREKPLNAKYAKRIRKDRKEIPNPKDRKEIPNPAATGARPAWSVVLPPI
jgi:hypothetical protein